MAIPPNGCNVYLSELTTGKSDFDSHYSLSNTTLNSGFNKSLTVTWAAFTAMVDSITTNPGNTPYVAPEDLAIKFIHRFDAQNSIWFLTAALCSMAAPDINDNRLLTEISGQRYDLKNGAITPSAFQGNYDQVYFDSLYYWDGTTWTTMSPNLEAKWNVFPWKIELKALYDQNFAVYTPSGTVSLIFDSCSFYCDTSSPTKFADVAYAHSVAVYIDNGGTILLDNTTPSANAIFVAKAADMATLCPPNGNCPYYVLAPVLHW